MKLRTELDPILFILNTCNWTFNSIKLF